MSKKQQLKPRKMRRAGISQKRTTDWEEGGKGYKLLKCDTEGCNVKTKVDARAEGVTCSNCLSRGTDPGPAAKPKEVTMAKRVKAETKDHKLPGVVANFYRLFKGDRSSDRDGKRAWFEKNRRQIKEAHLDDFLRRDLVVLASVVGYNPFQKTKRQVLTGTAKGLKKR